MSLFISLSFDYILFYIITIMWIGEFIVFPSKHQSEEYREDKSFKIILLGVLSSIVMTLAFTYLDIFVIRGKLGTLVHYIGLLLYTIGIVLRYLASTYLGKYFTRDVSVSEEQELVSIGPYRKLRHPLYLGLFLLSLGVPMFFQNIVAIIFSVFIVGKNINSRMKLEEKSMEDVMGDRYRDWKSNRYKFIPYIY